MISVELVGTAQSELRKKSRIAAFWYLLVTLTGPFVLIYLPSRFIVPGDAATTLANITAGQALFRLGIVVEFVSAVCFLLTGLALYELFKAVDKGQARIMAALVVVSVPVGFFSTLFQIALLRLGSGADYLKALAPGQLQSLAMAFLDMQKQSNFIAQIFWGLWLLPLGILVIKSGFFPKILGALQEIACFGYLAGCLAFFLFPGAYAKINPIANIMAFGELPFILWLVVVGARLKSPREAAPGM